MMFSDEVNIAVDMARFLFRAPCTSRSIQSGLSHRIKGFLQPYSTRPTNSVANQQCGDQSQYLLKWVKALSYNKLLVYFIIAL